MHMIRHDDITPDQPAVTILCRLPFAQQNGHDGRRGQYRAAMASASRDEINRAVDANPFQPPQMHPFRHDRDYSRGKE
jgi:hypothetical protein